MTDLNEDDRDGGGFDSDLRRSAVWFARLTTNGGETTGAPEVLDSSLLRKAVWFDRLTTNG